MFVAEVIRNPDCELEFALRFPGLCPDPDAAVRVQLVDADKFFMPAFSSYCSFPVVTQSKNALQLNLSLMQILENCNATNLNSRVMEIVMSHQGEEEFVTCEEGFSDIVISTDVVTYRLCLGKGKNLVLRLDWKQPTLDGSYTMEAEQLRVVLKDAPDGQLALRRRVEHDIVSYDRETFYEKNEEGHVAIEFRHLIEQTSAEKTMFGMFYRVAATDRLPAYYCRVVTDCDNEKKVCLGREIVACKTKDRTASISVSKSRKKVCVANVESTASEVIFTFREGEALALKLQRNITLTAGDGTLVHPFLSEKMVKINGNRLPLMRWNNIHQRIPMVFRLLAQVNGKECLAVAENPFEITVPLAHQDVTVRGNAKEVTVEVCERHNKIKLGILGTCMTRWAFSRKYTDAYRDLYDVAFAHFWPSVFALTSEAEEYPEQMYAAYPETETQFVRREYEKTSLTELKEADCEYVLIDFFVDAIHGPRRMKNGNFIGYKGYARDFYQDYLMFDTEKYFLNENDYFENWKRHADRLIQQLQLTMPENRVILAVGGLTHNFLSEDGCVKSFDGMVLRNSYMTKHSINALDYLWDKMNAYFIEKMPNAQVLDMRAYGFPAFDKNPANVRPYHFRNGYYRAMSAEVSRLILWDKQNR